jgi:hypothetical protein
MNFEGDTNIQSRTDGESYLNKAVTTATDTAVMSTDGRMGNKSWYIHTMEYNTTVQRSC